MQTITSEASLFKVTLERGESEIRRRESVFGFSKYLPTICSRQLKNPPDISPALNLNRALSVSGKEKKSSRIFIFESF